MEITAWVKIILSAELCPHIYFCRCPRIYASSFKNCKPLRDPKISLNYIYFFLNFYDCVPLYEPSSSRFFTFPQHSTLDVHWPLAISALWFLLSSFHLHWSTRHGKKSLLLCSKFFFTYQKQFKVCPILFSLSFMKNHVKLSWSVNVHLYL